MNTEYTVELVAQILLDKGLIAQEQHEEILKKHRGAVSSLSRKLYGPTPARHEIDAITPPEVIGSMRLFEAGTGQFLEEDRIVDAVAQGLGIPYKKIDKLKLDMKLITETISRAFAERRAVLPLSLQGNLLTIAIADPFDVALIESLVQSTGREIRPVLSARTDIVKVIAEVFGFQKQMAAATDEQVSDLVTPDIGNFEQLFTLASKADLQASDKHVVAAVDYLFHYALSERASDIHIEPKRNETQVRMRIDGVLHNISTIPKTVHNLVISRLKIMSRMDIAEKRLPQDGRIKISREGREVELRLSTLPVAFGEKMVVRVFDPELVVCDLGELGMFPRELKLFERMIKRPNGLVIITGPTGSGKTTTLYSVLRELSSPEVNIITIEDPVEMIYETLNQVTVQPKLDLTFAMALRTVLRQDPDVIMVGEIRDPETAQMAVQAALTGHLVLTTLHTNDSVSAISRLVELKVPRYLISSTLVGVVAQRLVRKICAGCKTTTSLTPEQAKALGLSMVSDESRLPVYKGSGCNVCRDTGLKGRTGIYELLEVTDKLRGQVNQEVDDKEILKTARAEAMMTLRECALKKLATGITSFDEVLRVTIA
jgi:general secretion pathway protein E